MSRQMALTSAKVTVLPSASSDVDTLLTAFKQFGVLFAPVEIDLTKIRSVSYKNHIEFCDFISKNVIYSNTHKLPTLFPVHENLGAYTTREIVEKRALDTNLDIKLDPFLRQDFYDLDIYFALEEVVNNAENPEHMQRTLDIIINALFHLDALRKLRTDWALWHTGAFVNNNRRVIDRKDNSARFLQALKKTLPLIEAKLFIFQIKTIVFNKNLNTVQLLEGEYTEAKRGDRRTLNFTKPSISIINEISHEKCVALREKNLRKQQKPIIKFARVSVVDNNLERVVNLNTAVKKAKVLSHTPSTLNTPARIYTYSSVTPDTPKKIPENLSTIAKSVRPTRKIRLAKKIVITPQKQAQLDLSDADKKIVSFILRNKENYWMLPEYNDLIRSRDNAQDKLAEFTKDAALPKSIEKSPVKHEKKLVVDAKKPFTMPRRITASNKLAEKELKISQKPKIPKIRVSETYTSLLAEKLQQTQSEFKAYLSRTFAEKTFDPNAQEFQTLNQKLLNLQKQLQVANEEKQNKKDTTWTETLIKRNRIFNNTKTQKFCEKYLWPLSELENKTIFSEMTEETCSSFTPKPGQIIRTIEKPKKQRVKRENIKKTLKPRIARVKNVIVPIWFNSIYTNNLKKDEKQNSAIYLLKQTINRRLRVNKSRLQKNTRRNFRLRTSRLIKKLNQLTLDLTMADEPPQQLSVWKRFVKTAKSLLPNRHMIGEDEKINITRVIPKLKGLFAKLEITIVFMSKEFIEYFCKNNDVSFIAVYNVVNEQLSIPKHVYQATKATSDLNLRTLSPVDKTLAVIVEDEEFPVFINKDGDFFFKTNKRLISGTPVYQRNKTRLVSQITWYTRDHAFLYYFIESRYTKPSTVPVIDRTYCTNETTFCNTVNPGCPYNTLENDILDTGCACGILKNMTFNGTIHCECHHCRGSWRHVTPQCPTRKGMIHHHILACRFGGPKRGENCFNDPELEPEWTKNEMLVAQQLAKGKICDVFLDPNNKKYNFNCKNSTVVANTVHSTKNKKIGDLANKLAAASSKKDQLTKSATETSKKIKKTNSEIKTLQNQLQQLAISSKKQKSKKKGKQPTTQVSDTQHCDGVYIPNLHEDWIFDPKYNCVRIRDSVKKMILPLHCINPKDAIEMKKTLHNYTDCLSSEIFAPITETVYLGKPNGEAVHVDEQKKLLSFGFDGEMLSFQEQSTFEFNKNLASGTPVFNKDGKLCSVILQSYNAQRYGLVGFYGTRGRISCEKFEIKQQEKPMIYGDQDFGFKPDLVNFVSNAKTDSHRKVCIWIPKKETDNIRICLLDGNKEIYHQYLTQNTPLINKKHSTLNDKTKKNKFTSIFYIFFLIMFLFQNCFAQSSQVNSLNYIRNMNTINQQVLKDLTTQQAKMLEIMNIRLININSNCDDILKNFDVGLNHTFIDQKLITIYNSTTRAVNRIKKDTIKLKKLSEESILLKQCIKMFENCTNAQMITKSVVKASNDFIRSYDHFWKDPQSYDITALYNNQNLKPVKFDSLSNLNTNILKRNRRAKMFVKAATTTQGTPVLSVVKGKDFGLSENEWTIGDSLEDILCTQGKSNSEDPDLQCNKNSSQFVLGTSCSLCNVARGNIREDGSEYLYVRDNCSNPIRCNLACLTPTTLYHLLNLQPMTKNCLLPIFKVLVQNKYRTYTGKTIVELSNSDCVVRVYEENLYYYCEKLLLVGPRIYDVDNFACYSKKLAIENSPSSFRNRIFMCQHDMGSNFLNEPNLFFKNVKPISILLTMFTMVILIQFLKYVGTIFSSILIILVFFISQNYASMCSSEVTSIKAILNDPKTLRSTYLVSSYVNLGDCIDLNGMSKLRFERFETDFVYNFKHVYPSEFKLECCDWIFNCPIRTNTVCEKNTKCKDKAKNNWQYLFEDCRAEKTPWTVDCGTTGVMNTLVQSVVSIPNNTDSYIYLFETQTTKHQQRASLNYELTIPTNITKPFNITQKHGYSDSLLKIKVETLDIEVFDTYKYVLLFDKKYFCAHTLPDIKSCISTNFHLPHRLVSRQCAEPIMYWRSNGFKCKLDIFQPINYLTSFAVVCPKDISFTNTGQSIVVTYPSNSAFVKFNTEISVKNFELPFCSSVSINSIENTECKRDWYKVAIVTITGISDGECLGHFDFSPCVIHGSSTFKLSPNFIVRVKVLCGIKKPSEIVVGLKDGQHLIHKLETSLCTDLNFALESSVQTLVAIGTNIDPGFNLNIDWFNKILKFLTSFTYIKYVVQILLGCAASYLIANCLIVGNWTLAIVFLSLFSYLGFLIGAAASSIVTFVTSLNTGMYRLSFLFGNFIDLDNIWEVQEYIDNLVDVFILLLLFYIATIGILNLSYIVVSCCVFPFSFIACSLLDKNFGQNIQCLFVNSTDDSLNDTQEFHYLSFLLSKFIPNKSWNKRKISTLSTKNDLVIHNGKVNFTNRRQADVNNIIDFVTTLIPRMEFSKSLRVMRVLIDGVIANAFYIVSKNVKGEDENSVSIVCSNHTLENDIPDEYTTYISGDFVVINILGNPTSIFCTIIRSMLINPDEIKSIDSFEIQSKDLVLHNPIIEKRMNLQFRFIQKDDTVCASFESCSLTESWDGLSGAMIPCTVNGKPKFFFQSIAINEYSSPICSYKYNTDIFGFLYRFHSREKTDFIVETIENETSTLFKLKTTQCVTLDNFNIIVSPGLGMFTTNIDSIENQLLLLYSTTLTYEGMLLIQKFKRIQLFDPRKSITEKSACVYCGKSVNLRVVEILLQNFTKKTVIRKQLQYGRDSHGQLFELVPFAPGIEAQTQSDEYLTYIQNCVVSRIGVVSEKMVIGVSDDCKLDFQKLIDYDDYMQEHETDKTNLADWIPEIWNGVNVTDGKKFIYLLPSGTFKNINCLFTHCGVYIDDLDLAIYVLRCLIIFGDWLIEIHQYNVFETLLESFVGNPLTQWKYGNHIQFTFNDPDDVNLAKKLLMRYYRTVKASYWPESAKVFKSAQFGRPPVIIEGIMATTKNEIDVSKLSTQSNILPNWLNENIHYTAIVSDGVSIGRVSGIDVKMASCVHVVEKAKVKFTNVVEYDTQKNSATIDFGTRQKGNVGEKQDIAVWNNFEFTNPVAGEIYCVVDHVLKKKVWLKCETSNASIGNDPGNQWSFFTPVIVDFDKEIIKNDTITKRIPGLSGSPIIDCDGNTVGLWGKACNAKFKNEHVFAIKTKPAAVSGETLDYFVKAAEVAINNDIPDDLNYFYLIAPTGTGKTMIFSSILCDKLPKHSSICVLQPRVTAAWNAYNSISSYVKNNNLLDIRVEISIGERNDQSHSVCGTGTKLIHIMTYGKFNVTRSTRLDEFSYILVDEAHVRNDPTIIETQIWLSKQQILNRKLGSPSRPIYLTATNCGFEKFGKNIGNSHIPSGTRFEISEEIVEYSSTSVEKNYYILDLDKAGGKASKTPFWKSKKIRISKNELEDKKTLIFVPTIDHTKQFEKQLKDQNPNLNVFRYYAGCGLSLENLPDQSCIVTTDALGMSVTINDVSLVVDLGLEIKPQVNFQKPNPTSWAYERKLQCQQISRQDHEQRKGRTGRTCPGKCLVLPMNFTEIEMWQLSLIYEIIWKIAQQTQFSKLEFEKYISDIQFLDVKQILKDSSIIHPAYLKLNVEKCRIACDIDVGDPIALALKPVISEEWIQKQESTKEEDLQFHHKSTAIENIGWIKKYKSYFDSTSILKQISDEKEKMNAIGISVYSDANDIPDNEWTVLDARLYQMTGSFANIYLKRFKKVRKALSQKQSVSPNIPTFGSQIPKPILKNTSEVVAQVHASDESSDSMTALIPILSLIGGVLAGSMLGKTLIRNFGTKYMIRVGYCDHNTLIGTIKNYADMKRQDISTITWIDAIIEKIKSIFRILKRGGINLKNSIKNYFKSKPSTSVPSMSFKKLLAQSTSGANISNTGDDDGSMLLLLDQIKVWCYVNWPMLCTPIAGAGAALGGVAGLTVDAFTNIFSPTIALPLWTVLTGLITVLGGVLPGVGTVIVSGIVYLLKTSLTSRDALKKALNPYLNKCGTGLVAGGLVGVGVGYAFSPEILKFLKNSNNKTLLPLVNERPIDYQVGRHPSTFCNHMIIAKHIYMLINRCIYSDELDYAAVFAAIIETVFHCIDNFGFKMIYTIIGVGVLCALRYLFLHFDQDHIMRGGSCIKSDKAYADWREHRTSCPEWFDTFISAIAVCADPTSLITIVLNWFSYWLHNQPQNFNRKQFVRIFQDYAGVNATLGIFVFLTTELVRTFERVNENMTTGLDITFLISIFASIPATLWGWWEIFKKSIGVDECENMASGFCEDVIAYLTRDSNPKKFAGELKQLAISNLTQENLSKELSLALQCIKNINYSKAPEEITDIMTDWLEDTLCNHPNVFFKPEFQSLDLTEKQSMAKKCVVDLIEWDKTRRLPGALSNFCSSVKTFSIYLVKKIKMFFLWLSHLFRTISTKTINAATAMFSAIGYAIGAGFKKGVFSWNRCAQVTEAIPSLDARASQFEPTNRLQNSVAVSKLVNNVTSVPSTVNFWIGKLIFDSANALPIWDNKILDDNDLKNLGHMTRCSTGRLNIPLELLRLSPASLHTYLKPFFKVQLDTNKTCLIFDVFGVTLTSRWRWDGDCLEFSMMFFNTILYGYCTRRNENETKLQIFCGGTFAERLTDVFISFLGFFPDTQIVTIDNFRKILPDETVQYGPSIKDFKIEKSLFSRVSHGYSNLTSVSSFVWKTLKSGQFPTYELTLKITRELFHGYYIILNKSRTEREMFKSKIALVNDLYLMKGINIQEKLSAIAKMSADGNGIVEKIGWVPVDEDEITLLNKKCMDNCHLFNTQNFIVPQNITVADPDLLTFEDFVAEIPAKPLCGGVCSVEKLDAQKIEQFCRKSRITVFVKTVSGLEMCTSIGNCKCCILYDCELKCYYALLDDCHSICKKPPLDTNCILKDKVKKLVKSEIENLSQILKSNYCVCEDSGFLDIFWKRSVNDTNVFKINDNFEETIETKSELLIDIQEKTKLANVNSKLRKNRIDEVSARELDKILSSENSTSYKTQRVLECLYEHDFDDCGQVLTTIGVVFSKFINSLISRFESSGSPEHLALITQNLIVNTYGLHQNPSFEMDEPGETEFFDCKDPLPSFLYGFIDCDIRHRLTPWHETLYPKAISDAYINIDTNVRAYEADYQKLKTQFSKLPYDIQQKLKYKGRVLPPHLNRENNIYASAAAIKFQQLEEIVPGLFDNVKSVLDPCCGSGGFEEYMSYLGTQKGQPQRDIFYQTLKKPAHDMPNINVINAKNSTANLIYVDNPTTDGDIRDPIVRQNLNIPVDMLVLDVGEGDNNSKEAAVWPYRRNQLVLRTLQNYSLWNSFCNHFNVETPLNPRENELPPYIKSVRIQKFLDRKTDIDVVDYHITDGEYLRWHEQFVHSPHQYKKVDIIEKELNVLKTPVFAHCISGDFALSAGLASKVKKQINFNQLLLNDNSVGNVIETPGEKLTEYDSIQQKIFHLITKGAHVDRPTYFDIWNTLRNLKDILLQQKIKKVWLPKIACGLDGKSWEKIRSMLCWIFYKTGISIVICLTDDTLQTSKLEKKIENNKQIIPLTYPNGKKLSFSKIFSLLESRINENNKTSHTTVCFHIDDDIDTNDIYMLTRMINFLSSKNLNCLVTHKFLDVMADIKIQWNSHLEAMTDLIKNLNTGGTLILRQAHINRNSFPIVSTLVQNFKKISAIKIPTTSFLSGEYYLICQNYNQNYTMTNPEKLREILNQVLKFSHEAIIDLQLCAVRPHKYLSHYQTRQDWFKIIEHSIILKSLPVDKEQEPPTFKLEFAGDDDDLPVQIDWKADWAERIQRIELLAQTSIRAQKFTKGGRSWKALYNLGSYTHGIQRYKQPKHVVNDFIEEGLARVFGIHKSTSCYGPTQDTEEATATSYQKRLDRDPGMPDRSWLLDLMKTIKLQRTQYGKQIIEKCRFLEKDEILALVNNKGAVGKFDNFGTMQKFIESTPNWYERMWEERIVKWYKDENTDEYLTVRNKLESKFRDDANVDGTLKYSPGSITSEELIKNSEMIARQITFGDALTRLAHIAVYGDLVFKHNTNKTYQGSITGCPPQYQGRVIRQLWDLYQIKRKPGYDEKTDTYLEMDQHNLPTISSVRGATLDFSKFDFTQTIAERAIQSYCDTDFFKSKFHKKVINGLNRNLAFSINVNDFGDIWGKCGMRNSGEITTSYGNTQLAKAIVTTAIARILNIPIADLTTKIGTLYYYIGGSYEPTISNLCDIKIEANRENSVLNDISKKWLKYEITRINVFADGDDIVLVGNHEDISKIVKFIDKKVEAGKKILRSETKSGVKIVEKFEEINFCSHYYRYVEVSRDMHNPRHVSPNNATQSDNYKVYWLQTRSSCLALGKLLHTLKIKTAKFDSHDEEALSITRGKLLSYLLLYPHQRLVRAFCITGLALLGRGSFELEKIRGVPMKVDAQTITGAFYSMYGTDVTGISYLTYNEEKVYLNAIRHNARIIGKSIPSIHRDIEQRCAFWFCNAYRYITMDLNILKLHQKILDYVQTMT